MTSHVFRPSLTYLATIFGAMLDSLPTLKSDVMYGRSLSLLFSYLVVVILSKTQLATWVISGQLLGSLWATSAYFFPQPIGLKDFSVLFSPFFLLLLDLLAIDTGFKKGRGNRQGGGKSQFEFPARMILLKKSFVTFSSQKSRPVKRPSIPLAYRAKMVLKL